MGDHIIDTNVLLVASARDSTQDSGPGFTDSNVPSEQQEIVREWLKAFRTDGQRNLVLDGSWKIWREYRNNMTEQDLGLMVVKEKLSLARFIEISYDKDGHGCLPADLAKVDPSDRKFVALALKDLSDGRSSMIVSAEDRGWYNCEEALKQAGVVVLQLIEDWSRAKWKEKQKQKSKRKMGHRPARSRKKPT